MSERARACWCGDAVTTCWWCLLVGRVALRTTVQQHDVAAGPEVRRDDAPEAARWRSAPTCQNTVRGLLLQAGEPQRCVRALVVLGIIPPGIAIERPRLPWLTLLYPQFRVFGCPCTSSHMFSVCAFVSSVFVLVVGTFTCLWASVCAVLYTSIFVVGCCSLPSLAWRNCLQSWLLFPLNGRFSNLPTVFSLWNQFIMAAEKCHLTLPECVLNHSTFYIFLQN